MFDINFDIYGTAVSIFLFLMGGFIIFIYGANLKYKYREIQTTNNNAIREVSNALIDKKIVYIVRERNYFYNSFSKLKNEVYVDEKSFLSSSVYDVVNVAMVSKRFLISNGKTIFIEKYFKWVILFLSLNILWSLIFSFYIFVIICFSCLFVMFTFEYIYQKTIYKNAIKFTKYIFLKNKVELEKKAILSYLKYKKMDWVIKYFTAYFDPLVSSILLFRRWGISE